jgi:hypothetical protein
MAKSKGPTETVESSVPVEQEAEEAPVVVEQAPRAKQPMADMAGKVVRWVGSGNSRTITEKDWASVGIVHPTVHWERDAPFNDVPLTSFDLDPIEFSRCILADAHFRVVTLGD